MLYNLGTILLLLGSYTLYELKNICLYYQKVRALNYNFFYTPYKFQLYYYDIDIFDQYWRKYMMNNEHAWPFKFFFIHPVNFNYTSYFTCWIPDMLICCPLNKSLANSKHIPYKQSGSKTLSLKKKVKHVHRSAREGERERDLTYVLHTIYILEFS